MREAFLAWEALGLGLRFQEVDSREDAEIRIGFMQRDGAWSYVGRDVIDVAGGPDQRTMNFGWDLTGWDGADTALHEIGHTLGFPHEHQNPKSGIDWDEEAVYEELGGPPNNWSRDKTRWNIIRKIPSQSVAGTDWDPDSIMHYPFGPGLIRRPERYRSGLNPAPGLSPKDVAQAKLFYPSLAKRLPTLAPFSSKRLELGPGEQADFVVKPTASRRYTFQTFGSSDTVMVLFEDVGGDLRYREGDDDSGWARNARIQVRLQRGVDYVLRVRLYFADRAGEAAVMLW